MFQMFRSKHEGKLKLKFLFMRELSCASIVFVILGLLEFVDIVSEEGNLEASATFYKENITKNPENKTMKYILQYKIRPSIAGTEAFKGKCHCKTSQAFQKTDAAFSGCAISNCYLTNSQHMVNSIAHFDAILVDSIRFRTDPVRQSCHNHIFVDE